MDILVPEFVCDFRNLFSMFSVQMEKQKILIDCPWIIYGVCDMRDIGSLILGLVKIGRNDLWIDDGFHFRPSAWASFRWSGMVFNTFRIWSVLLWRRGEPREIYCDFDGLHILDGFTGIFCFTKVPLKPQGDSRWPRRVFTSFSILDAFPIVNPCDG